MRDLEPRGRRGEKTMGAFQVDDSQWPLVRIVLDQKQTDADVDQFLADLGALLERGEAYVVLAEIRGHTTDFGHIKKLARWTLDNAGRTKEWVAGVALVIPSDTFRFMLSAFIAVAPMPCPFLSTTSPDEALTWLAEHAREREIAAQLA
jgi:hypothetical protein